MSPTTVRTTLQIDGAELPWDDWALGFQEQLPRELADLQDRLGARSRQLAGGSVTVGDGR